MAAVGGPIPLQRKRLGVEAVAAARSVVNDHYNIEHGENWELLESVAGLYNRLVIWDAALFHSTTTYDHLPPTAARPPGRCSCSSSTSGLARQAVDERDLHCSPTPLLMADRCYRS